ncbi:hypothetical protein U6M38_12545, partial [Cutibacterium acnes]
IDANEAHEKMFITWHKQRNGSGPSTDRPNSTAASPVAPATATTTAYSACSSPGARHTNHRQVRRAIYSPTAIWVVPSA